MTDLPVNTSFSQIIPNLQLAWDSTSLGTLKECPRKYEMSIRLGYVPREESVHLVFGLLMHGSIERYHHAKVAGQSHDQALCEVVRWLVNETWDKELGRPKAVLSNDPNKNRFTIVRTVVWYFDQFENDPLETLVLANGKPAVELSFRMDLDRQSLSGESFVLCGHMDRVVIFNGFPYIEDTKTTKNTIGHDFFDKYSPDNQFSTYCLAGKTELGIASKGLIVNAAQVAVTFSRFVRGFVERSDAQLQEFYEDTLVWIELAESFARRGHWPMNDKSCNNYGGCAYRGVCSKSPLTRGEWLERGFAKRVWDPLQRRGDI